VSYDVPAIREAIAAAVRANEWTEAGYRVNATGMWPASVVPPAFAIMDVEADDHASMGPEEAADLRMTGRLAVGTAESQAAQKVLDTYLSRGHANSVLDAIEAAEGLDITCTGFDGYRLFEWAGRSYFGAEIEIEVMV
jgi:hypothetical protein